MPLRPSRLGANVGSQVGTKMHHGSMTFHNFQTFQRDIGTTYLCGKLADFSCQKVKSQDQKFPFRDNDRLHFSVSFKDCLHLSLSKSHRTREIEGGNRPSKLPSPNLFKLEIFQEPKRSSMGRNRSVHFRPIS